MNTKARQQVDFYLGGILVLLLFKPVQFVGWLLKRRHTLLEPKNVLFVKMLGGGSLLMLLPTLESLRTKYPNAKFSILCSQNVKGFAKAYGVFDDIMVIDDSSIYKLLLSSLKTLFKMGTGYDTVVDLEVHSKLTTALTTISCIRNRIGFVDHESLWRRRLYTHAVFFNPQGQQYDQYDILAAAFGCQNGNIKLAYQKFKDRVRLFKVPDEFALPKKSTRVAVGLGCSDLAYERQMQTSEIAELLQRLAEKDKTLEFVFLGGKADFDLSEKVISLAQIAGRSRNFCGPLKLEESLKVLSECENFVGIDSALIHFARSLGLKVVGFWGPTSPVRLLRPLPIQEKNFYQALSCSPCLHLSALPPCLGQNICMSHKDNLSVAVDFILDKNIDPLNVFLSSRTLHSWMYTPQGGAPERLEFEAQYT